MNDLSEQGWQEYLAREDRDVMRKALEGIRSAQASLQVVSQEDLYEAVDALAGQIELRLKELYK
jgi:hypothetical protein